MKQLKETKKLKTKRRFFRRIYLTIIGIIFFCGGYYISGNILTKTISNKEFEMYEQVAQNYYDQFKKSTIVEIPKGVVVKKTDTCIIVYHNHNEPIYKLGRVIATLQNGKLVFERDNEVNRQIKMNVIMGTLFAVIVLLWIKLSDEMEK